MTGYVRDSHGHGVFGYLIVGSSSRNGWHATTAADGSYSALVPAGRYTVTASPANFDIQGPALTYGIGPSYTAPREPPPIVRFGSGGTRTVNFALPTAGGITVNLVDQNTGLPIGSPTKQYRLWAYFADGSYAGQVAQGPYFAVSPSFAFTQLPAANLRIRVDYPPSRNLNPPANAFTKRLWYGGTTEGNATVIAIPPDGIASPITFAVPAT